MAVETKQSVSASERPRSVVAFVSALGAFMLAAFATFYPPEIFPQPFLVLPLLVVFFGALGYGIWTGSRASWLINVFVWGSLVVRTTSWFISGEGGALGAGPGFNYNLLRLMTAAVLLSMLLAPSLFRWIWKRDSTRGS